MTQPLTFLLLDTRREADPDDITHTTECHDDNRALCGEGLTGEAWLQNPRPDRECVVCLDLEPIHCGCDCGCCDGPDS